MTAVGQWISAEVMLMAAVTIIVHCCYVRDRRSSGMLDGVDWQLLTDVSGEKIGTIFKGRKVAGFTVRDRTDGL